MTTITEITCEKCLRPLIPSGPASQPQGISTYGFFISKCKHFYRKSCISELYNTPTSANSKEPHSFICQSQNCATLVKYNEIFTIAPSLQTRTIHSAGSTMPDENLKPTTEIVCEKCLHPLISPGPANQTPQITSYVFSITNCKHFYHQSCIRDLYNTPMTSPNSEEPFIFICQNQKCAAPVKHDQIFTIVPTLQSRKIDSVTNDESSEPQAPSYANAATRTSKRTAEQPMKTITQHLSITLTAVNQTPKTTSSQIPKPKLTTNQNTSNKAPSQTTTCTQPFEISIIPAKRKSDAKLRKSKRKNRSSIARFNSPGPIEQTKQRHIRFQKRFKMDPEILEPFYPLNTYPFKYTAAGIQSWDGVAKIAILAKDVLMIGDGLIYGMVQLISTAIPFEFDLHPALYKRDLDILDLVVTLDFLFPKLPPRIMLSIGNWDVYDSIRSQAFHDNFQKLLQSFESRRVEELYLIPPIRYTTRDSLVAFAYVVSLFQADSGNTFGGKTMVLDPPPSFKYPIVDKDGPMFELELFEPFVRYIRERFIPPARENETNDEVKCTYEDDKLSVS
ncbi:uncharacterized protein LOC135846596 [Planococcus citri]|uniref:uncharacterized protein LOC135846596 n=1 Tax=Planococcus citri TaxID=170843 RepID=UPI0031F8F9AB